MTILNLHEFMKETRENSKLKGFHDKRTQSEKTRLAMQALTGSEIGEATDAVRDGDLKLRFNDEGKPLGLPSEIADIVIRELDYVGQFNRTFDEPDHDGKPHSLYEAPLDAEQMLAWLGLIQADMVIQDHTMMLQHCYDFAKQAGFDLDNVLMLKHQYNCTRPIMHGGKAL